MYKNNNVVVIGAGKIGSAIIKHLTSIKAQGDYKVTVIDSYQPSLDAISDIVQEIQLVGIKPYCCKDGTQPDSESWSEPTVRSIQEWQHVGLRKTSQQSSKCTSLKARRL